MQPNVEVKMVIISFYTSNMIRLSSSQIMWKTFIIDGYSHTVPASRRTDTVRHRSAHSPLGRSSIVRPPASWATNTRAHSMSGSR